MQRGVGAVVVLVACWALVQRLRAAPLAQRRLLGLLSADGIVAVLAFLLGPTIADWLFGEDAAVTAFVVQITVTALAPVAFLFVALRGGFSPTGEIEELGAWLCAEDRGRPQLTDVPGAALGDRTVELLFRVPGERGWVNGAGVPPRRRLRVPDAASPRSSWAARRSARSSTTRRRCRARRRSATPPASLRSRSTASG